MIEKVWVNIKFNASKQRLSFILFQLPISPYLFAFFSDLD